MSTGPTSVVQQLEIRNEEIVALELREREPLHEQNLLKAGEISLDDVFNYADVHDEWRHDELTISQFGIPDGTGGVNPGDRRALYYLVRYLRSRSILEIGTHIGASTIHIAAAVQRNSRMGGAQQYGLTTVDIVDVNSAAVRLRERSAMRFSPLQMISTLGLSDIVTFVVGESVDYTASCKASFDFIFLDGDHFAPTVYKEIANAMRLLNPGGIILLHDYFPGGKGLWTDGGVIDGPYRAVEKYRREGAAFNAVPLGTLPWPTKLQSQVTSLALLLRD